MNWRLPSFDSFANSLRVSAPFEADCGDDDEKILIAWRHVVVTEGAAKQAEGVLRNGFAKPFLPKSQFKNRWDFWALSGQF